MSGWTRMDKSSLDKSWHLAHGDTETVEKDNLADEARMKKQGSN
jgi:hypothetical protein